MIFNKIKQVLKDIPKVTIYLLGISTTVGMIIVGYNVYLQNLEIINAYEDLQYNFKEISAEISALKDLVIKKDYEIAQLKNKIIDLNNLVNEKQTFVNPVTAETDFLIRKYYINLGLGVLGVCFTVGILSNFFPFLAPKILIPKALLGFIQNKIGFFNNVEIYSKVDQENSAIWLVKIINKSSMDLAVKPFDKPNYMSVQQFISEKQLDTAVNAATESAVRSTVSSADTVSSDIILDNIATVSELSNQLSQIFS